MRREREYYNLLSGLSLSERQRGILILYVNGVKLRVIGEKYDITERTVRDLIHGNPEKYTPEYGPGIYGYVEELYGERPWNRLHLTQILLEKGIINKAQTTNE